MWTAFEHEQLINPDGVAVWCYEVNFVRISAVKYGVERRGMRQLSLVDYG
jgi:hypothetical protein